MVFLDAVEHLETFLTFKCHIYYLKGTLKLQ